MTSAIDPSISPARDRVIRRLARDVRRFPDLDLAPIDVEGLDARDAAFAHALHDGTIRRWLTLEYLLQLGLSKPIETLEPRVRAALLAAAAQLLFMDKAPAHAAVHESVEWAKRVIRPGAGSLVNAALRRLTERLTEDRAERSEDARNHIPLSSGAALILAEPCLPENDVERLAVATSNPVSLLRHWLKSMSMREVRALAVHGLARPPVILNTACAAAPLPEETTDSGDPLLIPHEAPGHHVFRGDRPRLISLLAQRNDIWVQDPASSLAVMSVTDLKPALVIDPCAGRGTKTRQLAAVFPNAEIIATDVDDDRRNDLTRAFRNHPTVRAIHPRDLAKWNARADLILLDVPCSNTGVLARRIHARYRVSPERTASLVQTQRQIIADALRLRSPSAEARGGILYSTCSLDVEENEKQAEWAAHWHAFSKKREHRRAPAGGPGEPAHRYSDGAYAVLLA